jgi:hypothetical protein
VRYLGHNLSPSRVTTDPENLEVVKSLPRTKDKHHLRSFVGLGTYYRRLISRFADLAKPLTRLTHEKRMLEWCTETEIAFQALKEAMFTAPLLNIPRPGETFIVDSDASNVGIGGVLSQVKDGDERVTAYFSKTLSKAGRNY